jgi:hypothetical protein
VGRRRYRGRQLLTARDHLRGGRNGQVLGSDQFFTTCDDLGGRGILEGLGMLEDDALHLPEFTLICGDGTAIAFPTTFSIDGKNGTLVEVTDGPPASQTFHRLSPRITSWR